MHSWWTWNVRVRHACMHNACCRFTWMYASVWTRPSSSLLVHPLCSPFLVSLSFLTFFQELKCTDSTSVWLTWELLYNYLYTIQYDSIHSTLSEMLKQGYVTDFKRCAEMSSNTVDLENTKKFRGYSLPLSSRIFNIGIKIACVLCSMKLQSRCHGSTGCF